MPGTGSFVTFEGLDASGKSTHLRAACRWLDQQGIAVLATHEPGGTALGDAIRGVFLDRQWGSMDGLVELLLVYASRRQHLLEVIEPALAAGRHVLCDRFSDSTFAYQGVGRGIPTATVEAVDELAIAARAPDLPLLFDLPAEMAWKRSQSPRRRNRRGGADRLDAEGLAFYERVREGFLGRARQHAERFCIIDSSGERDATEHQVRAALSVLLPGGAK